MRRDFGRDQTQVIEIIEVEHLEVHGFAAGFGERVDAFDDFAGQATGRVGA